MLKGILLLLFLFLIAFGIIFRDVLLLIELIRDFKSSRGTPSNGKPNKG